MRQRIGAVFLLAVVLAGGCSQDESTPIASAAGGSPAGPTGSAVPSSAPRGAIADPRQAGQAFVTCMRDRGQEIIDPPDPDDPRSAIRHELDVNRKGDDAQFQASLEACLPILPAPPPPSREQTKEDIAVDEALHTYSRCIQANGVPNYPDLSADAPERPAGGFKRTDPLPSIPAETERKCRSELEKLDAAQDAVVRAAQKRRG